MVTLRLPTCHSTTKAYKTREATRATTLEARRRAKKATALLRIMMMITGKHSRKKKDTKGPKECVNKREVRNKLIVIGQTRTRSNSDRSEGEMKQLSACPRLRDWSTSPMPSSQYLTKAAILNKFRIISCQGRFMEERTRVQAAASTHTCRVFILSVPKELVP